MANFVGFPKDFTTEFTESTEILFTFLCGLGVLRGNKRFSPSS
jgi:plastocyanin domain-containing protein